MKELPPAVAYCLSEQLFAGGSELYRIHRPAHVLAHELDWLTFVATRFLPPEKPREPWRIEAVLEGETRVVTPKVIVTRPLFSMEGDTAPDDFSAVEAMTRRIALAQEAGQIVILDLDDHPYGWNEEFADRGGFDPITDWSWWDDYCRQFNAVLCSTEWLTRFMSGRFSDQTFAHAPNLYDPWRYRPELARRGHAVGAHLFAKARFRADFERLTELFFPDPTQPYSLFDDDPELSFVHLGEELPCDEPGCGHSILRHVLEDDGRRLECEECLCAAHVTAPGPRSLSRLTGIPDDRIQALPPSSVLELHDSIVWNVGVVPLADTEFNYAKTEGKGFEMAAAGVPFVALTGRHPLYRKSPGWCGTEREARSALLAMIESESTWRTCSDIARAWAEIIAAEHQVAYVQAMTELSRHDLTKRRLSLAG